jgi:hypothetical protein
MNRSEILEKLNKYSSEPSFIYILARISARDFCGPVEDLLTHDNWDHLSYNEFAFLIGLWIKNADSTDSKKSEFQDKIFDDIYLLMNQLHLTYRLELPQPSEIKDINIYDFFDNGMYFQEGMFYSGTGAYDFQYIKWVIEKYSLDKQWILENKSINISSVSEFFKKLRNTLQNCLNKRLLTSNLNINDRYLNLFCFSKDELCNGNLDFENILRNFVVDLPNKSNSTFSNIGDYNIFVEKPIIRLADGRFFVPNPLFVAEALYESPFYWMCDDKSYCKTALSNRGEVAEKITEKILTPIFGNNGTYKNIKIKKNREITITDIDVLVTYKDVAIIFQVKSKKLTLLSKKGDIDSIHNDFKKAVSDAYEQGIIAKSCIENADSHIFEYDNSNRFFLIRK